MITARMRKRIAQRSTVLMVSVIASEFGAGLEVAVEKLGI